MRVLEAEVAEVRRQQTCDVVEHVRQCVTSTLEGHSGGALMDEVRTVGQRVSRLTQDMAHLTHQLVDHLSRCVGIAIAHCGSSLCMLEWRINVHVFVLF